MQKMKKAIKNPEGLTDQVGSTIGENLGKKGADSDPSFLGTSKTWNFSMAESIEE